jgi:mono/diheme cytochrome c family protein
MRSVRCQNLKTNPRRRWQRSPVMLLLLVLLWSVGVGWGLAQVTTAASTDLIAQSAGLQQSSPVAAIPGDPSSSALELGQESYLQSCAKCHVGVPPEVLPTETWQQLLQDPQHYGVEIQPPLDPFRRLIWNYVRTFSRSKLVDEETPYRLEKSRLFKALHPKVTFSQPPQLKTCATCHSGASEFNFRSLTPDWKQAP